mgnify:CR=1 FL=1
MEPIKCEQYDWCKRDASYFYYWIDAPNFLLSSCQEHNQGMDDTDWLPISKEEYIIFKILGK